MALFNFRQKEKPDIPKDAPKKKGLALVFSTLWREFFGLLKLNFVFILASLPIVTIPAAIKAMSRITISMVRDENYFLWHDFWAAFKDDFWKSFFGGLVFLAAFILFSFSILAYNELAMQIHWILLVLAAFSIALLLWAYLASLYFFPMNAYVNLKFTQLLKNSVILVFFGWKRSGLAFLAALITFGLPIALLPYSAVFLVFISFPLTNLLVSLALYPIIEKRTVLLEQETEETQHQDEKFLQSSTFKGWDETEEEEAPHSAVLQGWDDEPEEKAEETAANPTEEETKNVE
ncbi:MAG: YesL family protein [Lachnospiraceae bacterium]|nr:YesL family protein [Lachnospiraceae bacterium]